MKISRLVTGVAAVSLLFVASGLFGSTVVRKVLDVREDPALQVARPSESAFLAVTVAGKRLVAVGGRGRIVLSDDGGATWRQAKKVPVRVSLAAVRFATPQKGWAVGHSGVVLRSEDGGETWVMQLDGKRAAQLVFDSVTGGGGAGKGAVSETDPKVISAKRLVADGPDKPFLDVYVESEEKAFVLGANNLIFRTEDGGRSWQPWQSHVENPRELHLYAMRKSGRDYYLAGEQGTLLRSSDGGNTFKPLQSPYVGTFFGMIASRGGELVIFGLRGNAYWSGDQGRSWRKIETGITRTYVAGSELEDGTLLLASVAGDMLVSRDQGRTFQANPEQLQIPVSDVAQVPGGGLVAVGLRGVNRFTVGSASANTVKQGAVK
jgi:photosystem II stability/assembly factor-like uncharacterized protein